MSAPVRQRVSRALIVLGAVALLGALPLTYLNREVFSAHRFADNAARTLHDEHVRGRIATSLTNAIVARDPRAVAAAPLIASTTRSLLQTSEAASIVRRAATQTHNALFSVSKGSVVVDLANLGVVAIELLGSRRPDLARQLTEQQSTAVLKLANRSLTIDLVARADHIRWFAPTLMLLAVALLAAALLVAAVRRRAAMECGMAIVIVGVLSLVLFLVTRGAVLANPPGGDGDIARAVFAAFLGGFVWWCLAAVLAGVILDASAVSLARDLDPADLPAVVWTAIRREPQSVPGKVAGAVVLLLAGIVTIGDPLGALRIVTLILGAWMVFSAVVTLLRLLVGPPTGDQEAPTARAHVRHMAPVAIACALFVVIAVVAIALAFDDDSTPAIPHTAAVECNGSPSLCDKPFNEVVFPTSHNANATAQDLFLNANHGLAMISQLDLGVRGLMIDAFEGQRNARGVVRTDLAPKAVEAAEATIGPQGLAAAQRLAGSVVFGPVAGAKQLYLCHILCELGSVDGIDALREIRDWMDRNPQQVLLMVIEDAAPPAVIKDAFRRSGLLAYASDFQPLSGHPFPTLRQMISSGKRLFVMAEDHGDTSGWYHRAYDVMMETPFAFRSPAQLQTDASCRPNRGGTGKPLFLVNSWVESYPPNPRDADIVNQRAFLVDRARRCEQIRGHIANMVSVDFVERGDLIGATDQLNKVRPPGG